jgi:hypothetical protein
MRVIEDIFERLQCGRTCVLHCRGGVGRSVVFLSVRPELTRPPSTATAHALPRFALPMSAQSAT